MRYVVMLAFVWSCFIAQSLQRPHYQFLETDNEVVGKFNAVSILRLMSVAFVYIVSTDSATPIDVTV